MSNQFSNITQVAGSVPFDNATNGFTSTETQSAIEEVKNLVTESRKVKQAFEDFVFNTYGGTGGGGNSNQYQFKINSGMGSSDVEGSVTGTDYEGIHVLSSLAISNSTPSVESFNGINKVKVGFGFVENFEVRVRVGPLATTTEKFTTRYGLMDGVLTGLPANGVIFSYAPTYPVTPVAQVVTVTPIVTNAVLQTFTETVNGYPYSYIWSTPQVVTVTPNSFPNATFQQNSISAWSRSNNTLYTITINGFASSYTSDASASDAEIASGLVAAINANPNVNSAVLATGSAKPFTVTSKTLGQAFTITGSANITTISTTTANVPIAQYSETIDGSTYTFTSDGTPTASEVVAGLTALINADVNAPVVSSGTSTLILTAKTSGVSFTYSGDVKLTQADTSAITTATNVVTQLKSAINADVLHPVTASGTSTLILTADTAGVAFTYSGTANLTQALTTANVVETSYSGNWICSVINNSTVTSIDSGVAVVANRWDRLSCTVNAAGTTTTFYVNDVLVGEVIAETPTTGMRIIFKLEKTVGVTPRTTSIDYVYWNKER